MTRTRNLTQDMGERISLARRAAELSQTQLAEILGYRSSVSVSRIERAQSELPIHLLPLLARAVSMPVLWILGMEEDVVQPQDDMAELVEELRKQVDRLTDDANRLGQQMTDGRCGHALSTDEPCPDHPAHLVDEVPNEDANTQTRCYDKDCLLTPGHQGTGPQHYDGVRRYIRG